MGIAVAAPRVYVQYAAQSESEAGSTIVNLNERTAQSQAYSANLTRPYALRSLAYEN